MSRERKSNKTNIALLLFFLVSFLVLFEFRGYIFTKRDIVIVNTVQNIVNNETDNFDKENKPYLQHIEIDSNNDHLFGLSEIEDYGMDNLIDPNYKPNEWYNICLLYTSPSPRDRG